MSDTESVEKGSRLVLFLFGKPAWEIDGLEGEVDFKTLDYIDALATELPERLRWISKTARVLLNYEWDAIGGLYDIDFYKMVPVETAERELKDLGLDPKELNLEEDEFEE